MLIRVRDLFQLYVDIILRRGDYGIKVDVCSLVVHVKLYRFVIDVLHDTFLAVIHELSEMLAFRPQEAKVVERDGHYLLSIDFSREYQLHLKLHTLHQVFGKQVVSHNRQLLSEFDLIFPLL